ncbi:MAG TPA: TVP38/TMEM64 family protein [Planctomycetota bacterium]|nr:TVP38/TMEM64 family protein [Planctomycetota bacterium]
MSQDRSTSNGTVFFTAAVKAGVLVLFLLASTWVIIRYGGHLWKVLTEARELQGWVASYGARGPLVFLGIQVFQIIIFVVPGEVVQVAGGYLFGAWAGVTYCVVGAFVGSAIAFLAAKWLGRPFVRCVAGAEKFDRLEAILNRRKGIVTVFLLFLIPGIPKDILCYVAGLTPMRVGVFLTVSALARLPGMILSAYFGHFMAEQSYIHVAVVSLVAFLGLLLGLIFHRRIEAWLSRRRGQHGS